MTSGPCLFLCAPEKFNYAGRGRHLLGCSASFLLCCQGLFPQCMQPHSSPSFHPPSQPQHNETKNAGEPPPAPLLRKAALDYTAPRRNASPSAIRGTGIAILFAPEFSRLCRNDILPEVLCVSCLLSLPESSPFPWWDVSSLRTMCTSMMDRTIIPRPNTTIRPPSPGLTSPLRNIPRPSSPSRRLLPSFRPTALRILRQSPRRISLPFKSPTSLARTNRPR